MRFRVAGVSEGNAFQNSSAADSAEHGHRHQHIDLYTEGRETHTQGGKSQIEYISKHFVVSCCLSTPWWWHAAVNGLANGATGTRVYEFRLVENSKITIFGHYDYLGRNDRCRFR